MRVSGIKPEQLKRWEKEESHETALFWCWMARLAVLSLIFGILGLSQMVFWVLTIGLSVLVVVAVMMVLIRVVQFFRERRRRSLF